MTMPPSDARAPLPPLAPCRRLPVRAPLGWLRAGWQDFLASPRLSLIYGGAVFGLSAVLSALAWQWGHWVLVMAMLSGFVFVAPLMACGLYSVSRQIARGERPSLYRSLRRMRAVLSNALVFALVLMVIFLVWVRAAVLVSVFVPVSAGDWVALARFLAVGLAVGSIFALLVFSVCAFSLPMLVDRQVDAVTACITSVHAVLRNRAAMALWIALIVTLVGLSFVTLGLGLAVAVPVLGYATWHAYRGTIDARAWPEAGL